MLLLIPGPVTTHPEVKLAFSQDYSPWDMSFRKLHADMKMKLLKLANISPEDYAILPLQGCGHFAVEAALRTFVPSTSKILIPDTGDYSEHMVRTAKEAGRQVVCSEVSDGQHIDVLDIERILNQDPNISHVGLVSCETGLGISHNIIEVCNLARAKGRKVILDAVSSFGALPLSIDAMPELDAVVFTSNKCLEGFPGIGFVISPIERLEASADQACSWSFDLVDIYQHSLSKPLGTWRFTPSAQAVAALSKALELFDKEGGRAIRLNRYESNMNTLYNGMNEIGIAPYYNRNIQSPITVNFHAPNDLAWDLNKFVDALKGNGITISNFYNTSKPSFRVGCIGAVTPDDMAFAVEMIDRTLDQIGIKNRAPAECRDELWRSKTLNLTET